MGENEFDGLKELPEGNDPIAEVLDGSEGLRDLNRDLEQVPEVTGLLSLERRGIVHPKDFLEFNRLPFDEVKPLVLGEVWTTSLLHDLVDDKGRIGGPVVEEEKGLINFEFRVAESGVHGRTGALPGKQGLINDSSSGLPRSILLFFRVVRGPIMVTSVSLFASSTRGGV